MVGSYERLQQQQQQQQKLQSEFENEELEYEVPKEVEFYEYQATQRQLTEEEGAEQWGYQH